MSEVKLSSSTFISAIKSLQALNLSHPLLILLGKTDDVQNFGLNSALFLHLLSYEFPETAIVISDVITIITSQKKASILSQITGIKINVVIKGEELNFLSNQTFSIVDPNNIKGKFCENILSNIKTDDITETINTFFTAHKKIDFVKKSLDLNTQVFKKGKETILKNLESNISNKSISGKIENFIDSVDADVDVIYQPVIQSKRFDLTRFESDSGSLGRNILFRVGIRYNGYCSEIGRNFVSNMDDEIVEEYDSMFKIRSEIINMLNNVNDMTETVKSINEKFGNVIYSSGLVQNEGVNFGKCENYSLCLDIRKKIGSLILNLCDTIIIKNNIVTYYNDSINEYILSFKSNIKKEIQSKKKEVEKSLQRIEHQKELMDNLLETMIKLYSEKEIPIKDTVVEEKKKLIPYLKETSLPRHEMLYVDRKNYAVLVPLNNYVLPISIDVLKNVSKTDDGTLRLNLISSPEDSIKSISYKSSNDVINELYLKITEMKKEFNINKEIVKKDETNLILSARKIVLPEVFIKTDIRGRKSKANSLELHENGFRYNHDGTFIEILFDNIKHFFFQEGTIDTRAIIHFHLHNPVFIPKKTNNIQFYRDCGIHSVQDTSKIKDEYYENILEREEENKRNEINKDFRLFVEKVENISPLRVEIPTKSGSFYGVPFKGNVHIQPTNECLVNLVEFPVFVLTLSEIEVVCFERMLYGVKTFDMVFIHKNKDVTHILSIDSLQVQKIKDFIDGKNIPFIETKINLQWTALIKEVMKDPVSFYENGGWSELQPHRENDEEEESSGTDLEDTEASSDDESVRTDESTEEEESEEISSEENDSEDNYESEEDYESEEESSEYQKKAKKAKKGK